jgi:hypothetical protein
MQCGGIRSIDKDVQLDRLGVMYTQACTTIIPKYRLVPSMR